MNRFVFAAISAVALFSRAALAQQGQLDASPTLFTVMAALNMTGYDADLDSPLVLRGGNLYGTYQAGSGGVVFELQPPPGSGGAWTVKYLHEFTDGQRPFGPLVMDAAVCFTGRRGGRSTMTRKPVRPTELRPNNLAGPAPRC